MPLLLLLAADAYAATAPSLTVSKAAAPAEAIREGERQSLKTDFVVLPGDDLATGTDGRASLRFDELTMALGGDSVLRFAGGGPINNVGGPVLRLQLISGALRVDGRAVRKAPQDLRLNVGELRLRVLGSDVWVAAAEAQRTVCLLDGALEVQSERGSRRLDTPGDCLFVDDNGWRVDQLSEIAIMGRLSLTDYPATNGRRNSLRLSPNGQADVEVASVVQEPLPIDDAPVQSVPLPPPQPPPPASLSMPVAQTPPPGGNDGPKSGGWTLVALALVDGESAGLEALTFTELGLPAIVRPYKPPQGKTVYRVTIGSFATRKQAQAYNEQLKTRFGLDQLWIAPY